MIRRYWPVFIDLKSTVKAGKVQFSAEVKIFSIRVNPKSEWIIFSVISDLEISSNLEDPLYSMSPQRRLPSKLKT